MGYVSRKYLREKYSRLKHDMENVLKVLDTELEDSISEDDVERVLPNVEDCTRAILNELRG